LAQAINSNSETRPSLAYVGMEELPHLTTKP